VQALVFDGPRRIRYDPGRADPQLRAPTDAIVEIEVAGLCGSDLHPYLGREAAAGGVVPGHEVVGRVSSVGSGVAARRVGERVVVPFSTACGGCARCEVGLTARCERGALFGYGPPDDPAAALDGGQAQQLRVPWADATLRVVPAWMDAPTALLCSDNLPTAWEAVARAEPRPDQPLAVVGLGAVGLCAVAVARSQTAGPVVAVDPVADRRDRALALGADLALAPDEALAEPLLAGGVPAVVEASGSTAGQRLAITVTAPGGTCSVIAVQTDERFAFSPAEAYDRNLTLRFGRASVLATWPLVTAALADGHLRSPAEICVTHRDVALRDGPEAYARFAAREPGMVKVAFRP
jgi:alcohol dehydrogenase